MSYFDENKTLVLKYYEKDGLWRDVTSEIEGFIRKEKIYSVKFNNNPEWYNIKLYDIRVVESPETIDLCGKSIYLNEVALTDVSHLLKFDDWYKVFYQKEARAYPVSSLIIQQNLHQEPQIKNLLDYLVEVAKYISNEEECAYLSAQLNSLFVSKTSVLSKFIDKSISRKEYNELLIFPFNTNASQQRAVKIAMEEDISLIQGLPGTGKTQTILNIIAYMIFQGKSVAVVSGNNEAPQNVYDKLKEAGYEYLNASLGKSERVKIFFDRVSIDPPDSIKIAKNDSTKLLAQRSGIVKKAYKEKLKSCELSQRISELETEKAINDAEYALKDHNIPKEILKKHYTSRKLLELASVLQCISDDKYINFFDRVKFLFRYGIINVNKIQVNKYDIIEYLENIFYTAKISELTTEKDRIDEFLRNNNVENILSDYQKYSKELFDDAISKRFNGGFSAFTKSNYKYRFKEFVKRYPIVYSTTHSLSLCSGKNYLYDCVIIDESSQVDLVTAAIVFSCAKKVVLVGDEKQLTHVVKSSHVNKLNNLFEASGLEECYNYVKNNIMSCVKTAYPNIKSTLLREHYRCDPEIIEFIIIN